MHTENTIRMAGGHDPRVSIIIPARDEEANLERCLRSLVVQRGISFEIIVVDDGSADRTREIAETFTRAGDCPFLASNSYLKGVRVMDARPLAEGWTGKSNACATGAESAAGEWLLFTDADTEHLEGSLAKAVAEAEEHCAGLLSYSPEQVLAGASQKLVMPLIFAELATTYKPREINDPRSKAAAANGQYILIRESTYRAVGGFASVKATLLEDVELARRVKASGESIRFRLGKGAVRAHMYRDWSEMQAGWTKNLALLFSRPKYLAAKRLFEFFLLMLLPVFAVMSAIARHEMVALVEAFVATVLWIEVVIRTSRAHSGALSTILGAFGLPLFAALLLRSAAAYQQRQVVWKGRTYTGSVTSDPLSQSNTVEVAKSAGVR